MEFLNAFSHMDWTLVAHLTLQHITLVGIAVTLAIVVGVPGQMQYERPIHVGKGV